MVLQSLLCILTFMAIIYVSEEHNRRNGDCSELPGVECTPFKSAFSAEIANSCDLLDQFYVSLPPEEAAESFYNFTIPFFTKLGASDPYAVARDLVYFASCKLNGITPNSFAALAAKVVERFLRNENLLTEENAACLAQRYVGFLNIARMQPYIDGSPMANLFSLYDATTNLCLSFGTLTTKDADRLARNIILSYKNLPDLCD